VRWLSLIALGGGGGFNVKYSFNLNTQRADTLNRVLSSHLNQHSVAAIVIDRSNKLAHSVLGKPVVASVYEAGRKLDTVFSRV